MAHQAEPTGSFTTRMFTVGSDGSDRHILDPSGFTSHFIWRDSRHICAWTRPKGRPNGFYLFTDQSETVETVGEGIMTENGHNTYVPKTDNEWILNDTYPSKPSRHQCPYLFHVPSGQRVELGKFYSPPEYTGEWRCDTHPQQQRRQEHCDRFAARRRTATAHDRYQQDHWPGIDSITSDRACQLKIDSRQMRLSSFECLVMRGHLNQLADVATHQSTMLERSAKSAAADKALNLIS